MDNKQRLAIIAPPILIVIMYPIFHIFADAFKDNWRIGWFLGLAVYWLIWGGVFSICIIGKKNLVTIIRPQKPSKKVLLLVAFPLVMAAIYRFIPGMEYEKVNGWAFVCIFSSTLGNGLFEEILWRGVSMQLFPTNIFMRIIWPSIWFALWHYVPGSVSPSGNIIGLMIGAGMFGFYLSYLAKKTNTLWWCMVTHFLGGLIMVG